MSLFIQNKHRISTCKYRDKCPSLKRIMKQHTYTIVDLNHITEFSHPRKKCSTKSGECIHHQNLLNGGYDLGMYNLFLCFFVFTIFERRFCTVSL